jgi:hypothetical protein
VPEPIWSGASRLAEDLIQHAVFQHLALRGAPGVFAFHPANGGYRRPVEAARLKGLGVCPGVPAIELKAEGGRATDAQLQAIEGIRAAGGHAQICRGLDHALAVLEGRGCCAAVLGRARNR